MTGTGSTSHRQGLSPTPGGPTVDVMDNRDEIRDFLSSRRAKITPAAGGAAAYGAHRRVPGLRREEVAMLAGRVAPTTTCGSSAGNLAGVSDEVLEALAGALQLDEAERAHLYDLARTAADRPPARRRRPAAQPVPASVQVMLDAMTGAPAVVRNERLDILATNPLGRALYAPLYRRPRPARPTTPGSRSSTPPPATSGSTGTRAADDTVGILRTVAGRNPYDKALHDLVGELSTRSEDFRTRWARAQRAPAPRRHQAPSTTRSSAGST